MVNRHTVVFHAHKASGAEIKSTAIAQGVQIQQDFNLFEKRAGHPLKPIGDAEVVELHEGEEFRAVAPDDNSGQ
jgi:Multiubiquitin